MKKRLFSILLSICMVLTMIPMAGGGVFAQTTKTTEHKHCVCGAEHKEIGDHTAEDADESKTFQAWESDSTLPGTAGRYYLTKDVMISETWQPADGTVLCLNGKTITGDEKNTVIKMSGEFTLTDCAEVCGSITGGSCGVHVDAKKTFNMYNGLIKGNDSGVYAVSDFNMYSGVIKENKRGVYISTGGNFNMYGGSIIKNKTNRLDVVGVGVCRDGGRFTVSGNVQITGNLKGTEANNVYCTRSSGTISIGAGGLDETAQIGLKSTGEGALDIVEANDINYSDRFTADDAGYEICRSQSSNRLYFRMLQSLTDFNFTYKTLDRQYGDSVENQLNGVVAGDYITYSSNNPTVARVDRTTGEVTVVGEGKTVIKAIKKNKDPKSQNYRAYYTLTVNKRTAVAGDFTFMPPADLVYDGSAKTAQVALDSKYTGCGDITVKYYDESGNQTEAVNAGTYKVKVDIAEGENFASVSELEIGTFTIVAKELAEGMIANIPAQTYTGSEIRPEVTVTDGSRTLIKGTDYDVAYTGNTKVGTGSVKITGKGNYSGEITKTFVIDKADPAYTVPEGLTATYGDKLSEVTLPDGWSWINPEDTVGNVTAYGSSNMHKARYTPADTDNYNVIENIDVSVKVAAKQEADVTAPEIRVLAGESREVDLSSYKKNATDVMRGAHSYDNVFDSSIPPYKVSGEDKVAFTVKSDAAVGDSGTITVGIESADGNTYYDIQFKVTVRSKYSKPSKPVQKPSITAGEGFKAELSSDGTKATITVEEGYEIVDVLVNGISKGKVTEITGLKTGDTIEVKTEKKQPEPVKPADNKRIIKGVKNTEIELEITVNKDGNIVIKWKKSKGYRVDGFEILRAVKKNGKYSKIYTTKSGKASRIVNAKNLKDGKRYYYKVRGVRTIDGKKYYTEWSDIESEKVKK